MELSIHDPHYAEKAKTLQALYQVIDPELCVNIVDLGLVYDLDLDKDGVCMVIMTLSTPYCPLGEAITTGVKNVLSPILPDRVADVRLVWDPPWQPSMMTPEGRALLYGS